MHQNKPWVFLGSTDDFWRWWHSGFVFPTTVMHALNIVYQAFRLTCAQPVATRSAYVWYVRNTDGRIQYLVTTNGF